MKDDPEFFPLWQELIAKGEAKLKDMVADRQEEGLHLEFKELKRPDQSELKGDDASIVAKAIGGMANAEGGILILGVATSQQDQVDAASELKPIADVEAFRRRMITFATDAISSPLPIKVQAIKCAQGSGGYVALLIPESERRPHMSVRSNHRYFRRVSTGTRVMEHGEIRDMILAPRQGRLQLDLHARRGLGTANQRGTVIRCAVIVSVVNVGTIPVRNPYVAVHTSLQAAGKQLSNVELRRRRDSSAGFYTRDVVVHVEDGWAIATLEVVVQFLKVYLDDRLLTRLETAESDPEYLFRLQNDIAENIGPAQIYDEPITMTVRFGADNVDPQVQEFSWSRLEFFQQLLAPVLKGYRE